MPAKRPQNRPALTYRDLREIADRSRKNPDVLALLWEVRRLHDTLREISLRVGEVLIEEPAMRGEPPPRSKPPKDELLWQRLQREELEEARRLHPGVSDEQALKRLGRARRG